MTKREKQKSGILFIGTIVNSFVEILGLAAVVPVIGLVIEPELIQTNTYLVRAFEWSSSIGIDTERKFLMLTSGLLVAAFLFKAIIGLALNLLQTRFSLGIGHRLSGMMWQYHFAQSLERMRLQDSGRVMVEISSWPSTLSNAFIVGSMRLINELIIIAIITIGLFTYEPIVLFAVLGLLGLGTALIRKAFNKRLDAYSQIQRKVGPRTTTIINNAIKGFLEVITFRASHSILQAYLKNNFLLIRISSNSQIMNMAPAKLYEVLAVTAVSASIFIGLFLGRTNEEFLSLLILMALSAYRIMPSMSRINSQLMIMRQNQHVLEIIESSLMDLNRLLSTPQANPRYFKKVNLQLINCTIGYKNLQEPVLKDLTINFPSGSINGIVGPSGSGKSTLVNTILGLLQPTIGMIKAGDTESSMLKIGTELNIPNWLEHIGYLSQQPYLFRGSVRDNLTMMIPNETIDESSVNDLIRRLELNDCLGENPLDFEILEGGSNLSGGQQQRLAILRALRVQRQVLILDEATSALDHAKRDAVFKLLREQALSGTNVLLITHDVELANQCDTILDLEVVL